MYFQCDAFHIVEYTVLHRYLLPASYYAWFRLAAYDVLIIEWCYRLEKCFLSNGLDIHCTSLFCLCYKMTVCREGLPLRAFRFFKMYFITKTMTRVRWKLSCETRVESRHLSIDSSQVESFDDNDSSRVESSKNATRVWLESSHWLESLQLWYKLLQLYNRITLFSKLWTVTMPVSF